MKYWLAFLITLIVACLILASCGPRPVPPHRQASAELNKSLDGAHNDLVVAGKEIEAAKPTAGEVAAPHLDVAAEKVAAADDQVNQAKQSTQVLTTAVNAAVNELDAVKVKLSASTRRNAELENQWETNWLGGRFYRWLRYLIWTASGLLILSIVLMVLGQVGPGPFSFVCSLIGRLMVGIFPVVGSAISWLSIHIWERWRKPALDAAAAFAAPAAAPPSAPLTPIAPASTPTPAP